LAEIESKSGDISGAILHAKSALSLLDDKDSKRATALKIFIAKSYSKLGKINESNAIYRTLLTEENYLPPVIMGLLYNNFKSRDGEFVKMGRNLGLVKVFVHKVET